MDEKNLHNKHCSQTLFEADVFRERCIYVEKHSF